MARRIILVFFFLACTHFILHAQGSFKIHDVLAADPGASIIDPEYNMDLNMICWQSDSKDLWVCSVDPVTRQYVPSDGKGILVDHDLTPPTPGGWNGPEWMLGVGSTRIVYNQKKGDERYPGIATMILGGWESSTLMQYPGTLYSMATRNYSDSTGMFLFESVTNDGIRWVKSNDLNTSYFYPDITLGFFASDNQQICCALNHSRQPGFVEVQATFPFFTQISNDTIGAPFMWNDPGTNSRMFMYRTFGSQMVKIFQENSDGNWYLYNSFFSPDPGLYPYITSPEPFVFGGRSYISFMAAQSTMGLAEMPAQVWITSIDPANPLMRLVSNSSMDVRIDPEPVVFNDSAFIYYTEKVHTTHQWGVVHRVRRCDTGLENYFLSDSRMAADLQSARITPNPSDGRISLASGILSNQDESHVIIHDLSGRVVHSSVLPPAKPDLQLHLNNGMYLLELRTGQNTAFSRLVISN